MKKAQNSEHYEMPRRLNWDVFRKIYDIQPKNYEGLISIPGIGPAAVRAFSLIGEIIFGTKGIVAGPCKIQFCTRWEGWVSYPVAVRHMINP